MKRVKSIFRKNRSPRGNSKSVDAGSPTGRSCATSMRTSIMPGPEMPDTRMPHSQSVMLPNPSANDKQPHQIDVHVDDDVGDSSSQMVMLGSVSTMASTPSTMMPAGASSVCSLDKDYFKLPAKDEAPIVPTTVPIDLTRLSPASGLGSGEKTEGLSIGVLRMSPYYHGLLPRVDAQQLLQQNGDFLVRRTEVEDLPRPGDKCESLVLTLMWEDRPQHVIIHHTPNFSLWYVWNRHACTSVTDLITYHVRTGTQVTKEGGKLIRPVVRQEWQLSHEQIELGKKLGSGAFGDVFEASLRLPQHAPVRVAVKRLKAAAPSKEDRQEFIKEARLMRKYRHRHIVRLVGVACQQPPIMIVLELAPKGSLLSHLRKKGSSLPIVTHVRFCRESACGLRYLEQNKLIHRDVAARNCLLGNDFEVKITDFGLALQQHFYKETQMKAMPIKWLAPETMLRSEYSLKSDVWAYGVLVWEIFSNGQEPYPNMTNAEVIRQIVIQNYRMSAPPRTPDFIAAVMNRCWASRPGAIPRPCKVYSKVSNVMQSDRCDGKCKVSIVMQISGLGLAPDDRPTFATIVKMIYESKPNASVYADGPARNIETSNSKSRRQSKENKKKSQDKRGRSKSTIKKEKSKEKHADKNSDKNKDRSRETSIEKA